MSSTTNPGDRSAAEIEREVEQTRARLTGTVEELKERVSPGQVAEQAMEWIRGSGGREFLGNLGGTLRDNPMPVLLIAAGIGWLALGGRGEASPRRWRDDDDYGRGMSPMGAGGWADTPSAGGSYPGESYSAETYAGQAGGGTGGTASSLGARAGEAAAGLKDRAAALGRDAGETAGDLRDRAGRLAERAGEAASGAWDGAAGAARSVADRAGRALRSASEGASDLGRGAYRAGDRTGRRVAEAVEAQPLLLGALGLAVGAAIGALLPSSDAEDRMLGESRDRVADRLSTLAGETYDRAREVAGEHAQRAGEELGDALGRAKERVSAGTGSVREGVTSVLGEVARDLRETVERTAHDVAGVARDATDKPDRNDPPGRTPPATGIGPAGI